MALPREGRRGHFEGARADDLLDLFISWRGGDARWHDEGHVTAGFAQGIQD